MEAEKLFKKTERLGGIVNRSIACISFPNSVHIKNYSDALDLMDVLINDCKDVPITINLDEPLRALKRFLKRRQENV